MPKQQYRSELAIISDILSVTMDYGRDGAIISSISRRANLSYYAVIEKCKKLIDAGLVKSLNNSKNRIFVITEKGIQFFSHMQKFLETVKVAKIRY
ncbi:MAG: winged helix-turn-helix domain-containing protein [Nitrosotalea sp.]